MLIFLHQYGWDELLFFAVPVALGFFGLRRAEKKAKEKEAAAKAEREAGAAAPGD